MLTSPRRRRRLFRLCLLLVVLSGLAAAVVLAPGGHRQPKEVLRPAPIVREESEIPLTPAMRREINRTLDEFVPAAIGRRNNELAWELAAPGLRAGTKRSHWLAGDMPVHPYAYDGRPFRGWTVAYAKRSKVAIDLLLHPHKSSSMGPIAFGIDLVPVKGRWLVDSIFPAAIWSGKGERPFVTGSQDFTGKFGTKESTYNKPKLPEAKLGGGWALAPLLVLGFIPLLGTWFAVRALLSRRGRRTEALPPLPSSARPTGY